VRDSNTRRLWLEATAIFAAAMAFLFALAPTAPFTKELGVCESGAVRDVLAGNVILPHFVPGPIVHVPPLYWWTAALCVRWLGWNELALRLPSLVPAALTCAIVFAWVAATIGRRAALWAASSLLFCHFFVDAARQPRMDSMLALFVTAAAVCLERAIRRGPAGVAAISAGAAASSIESSVETATSDDKDAISRSITSHDFESRHRALFLAIAAVAMGLGILSKGVLGILLPGLAPGVYFLVRRRFWELFRPGLIACFAVGFVIGAAWYVAGYEVGGKHFLDWQFGMNLWKRFIPAEEGGGGYCVHPFYYFLPQTLIGFLPWSLYLPAVGVWIWPGRRERLPEPVVYAICWFASIFVFFSASQGKCLVYILPAFPPLAVLTGCAIEQVQQSRLERRALAATFSVGSAAAAIGVLGLAISAAAIMVSGVPSQLPIRLHPTDQRFLDIFAAMAARRAAPLMLWFAVSAIAALATLFAIRHPNVRVQAAGVLVAGAAGMLFWFGTMNPALAEHETLKGFAVEVAKIVPAGDRIGHFGVGDCELNFYTPQLIERTFHFSCDTDSSTPRYFIAREGDFNAMDAAQRLCLEPIARSAPVDSKGARLLLEEKPVAQ
jgi:4-amino-4-deoxy-L-arabinose transferase-like glycosyltransferase